MGVIQRQGVSSTLIHYVGAVLGYVNKMVLFTQFLTLDQVGLGNALPVLAVMLAQLSVLGIPNSILRFFPYFRDKEKQHHGFLAGFLGMTLIGFSLLVGLFFLFRPQLLAAWSERSPLLYQYSYLLIPFAFSYVIINFFEAYLKSLYDIAFMTFVKQVGLRLAVTLAISLYAFGWIDFDAFIHLYVGIVVAIAILPLGYTLFIGELSLRPRFGETWSSQFPEVMRYTFATFLPIAGSAVLNQLDIFMLTFESETLNGIYTTMVFAVTIIIVPWKALHGISSPLVVEHWKNEDMEEMTSLYQRTSLISMMAGTFIFLGLWLNRNNLIAIVGEEYILGLNVLLILGLAKVWDMTTGLNGTILITSPKYLHDLFFQIGLITIGIASNLILIPRYGMLGAALATTFSIVFINSARLFTVWSLYKLHPFTAPMLKLLVGAILTYYVCDVLPPLGSFLVDIPIRSALCTLLFVGLMLKWNISPDVNAYVWKWGVKFGLKGVLKWFIDEEKE